MAGNLREYLDKALEKQVKASHRGAVSPKEQENYAREELERMLSKSYTSSIAKELVQKKEAQSFIKLLALWRAKGRFTGLR